MAGPAARTTPATSPAASRRGKEGFALYELILALAILGMVAGVVFPRVARAPGPVELGAKAQQIAALLRSDRNAALRRGGEVVSHVDVAKGTVISGLSGTGVRVPKGVAVAFVQSSRELGPAGGGIRFYPDGRSSGGFLSLKRGAAEVEVSVNWLTGGVLVSAPDRAADASGRGR